MRTRAIAAPLLALSAAIAAIVAAVTAVLRLPGIPYNIRELFLDQASLPALIFFALTLIWIGAGPMLLAHVAVRSRRPYLMAPLALIVMSLVSKMLLSRSVTYESIDDIIGSNNLFGLVTRENVWGASWGRVFNTLGPDAVDFIERRVRYTALYSIPLLGIGLVFMLTLRSVRVASRMKPLDRFLLILCVGSWFWLARTLVVTWAATDNLTELIARRLVFGISGEWFLFAIPVVIGVSVVLLIHACAQPKWWPVAIVTTIAALPVGWTLLNLGLEPHVEKFGAVFSATQFLLGPDRRTTLSSEALFARWIAFQLSVVGVTFIGAWIAERAVLAGEGRASISGLRAAADAVVSRPHDRQDRV
jgi:hypothetical protein